MRTFQQLRWRTVFFYTFTVLAVVILLGSLPSYFHQLGTITSVERLRLSVTNPGDNQVGSFEYWLDFASMIVQLGASAICIGLAVLIFHHKREDRMALLLSFFLILFGTVMTGPLQTMAEGDPTWLQLVGSSEAILFAAWGGVFFLFPDGQFYPPWTRYLALSFLPWAAITLLFRDFFSPLTTPQTGQILLLFGWYMIWPVTMLVAQVMRYQLHSTREERQQTRWVIFGFLIFFGTLSGLGFVLLIQYVLHPGDSLLTGIGLVSRGYGLLWSIMISLVPLSMGVAVLRYRLWDIDFILSRTLVYGILTALVLCFYILTVEGISYLFNNAGSLLASLFATGLVIVIFLPLHSKLQRGVNRLVYGERDDPNLVFSRLGQRLKATLTPEATLPTILETVAQALKLPYVAIKLRQGDYLKLTAEYGLAPRNGKAEKGFSVFPLIYQNELMGELIVASRSPNEALTSADKKLLTSIADQAGNAAYTVRLLNELQASREGLVLAREEERRRLRRDLHDGLGSVLASLSFNLDAARNTLPQDPGATDALLVELKMQTQAAIADIRRLINNLRPPALDELGLVPALQQYIDQVNRPTVLTFSIQTANDLPALPAAVEVAAYRIILEALTNIIRHSNAKHCSICFSLANPVWLGIEIVDDGEGLATNRQHGIGLSTMRERAEELGGSFLIEMNPSGGTRVSVSLPVLSQAREP